MKISPVPGNANAGRLFYLANSSFPGQQQEQQEQQRRGWRVMSMSLKYNMSA